jgi:hypothetical protein
MNNPPIAAAATNPRYLGTFPDGADQLWMADVKICRHAVECRVFTDILFVESPHESERTTFIFGIEDPSGLPHPVPRPLGVEAAIRQQEFINFLRAETAFDIRTVGPLGQLFAGLEYRAEAKATAAYAACRGEDLSVSVGYLGRDGQYQLVRTAPEAEWLESARRTLPYHDLV